MLPIGLVAEGRGPRSSPLYPKVLGPAFQTGGAPCFAPQAVLTARGGATIDAQSDGTYRIGSFFDVFTEISLDGGNTWSGVGNPTHIELNPQPFPPGG